MFLCIYSNTTKILTQETTIRKFTYAHANSYILTYVHKWESAGHSSTLWDTHGHSKTLWETLRLSRTLGHYGKLWDIMETLESHLVDFLVLLEIT